MTLSTLTLGNCGIIVRGEFAGLLVSIISGYGPGNVPREKFRFTNAPFMLRLRRFYTIALPVSFYCYCFVVLLPTTTIIIFTIAVTFTPLRNSIGTSIAMITAEESDLYLQLIVFSQGKKDRAQEYSSQASKISTPQLYHQLLLVLPSGLLGISISQNPEP